MQIDGDDLLARINKDFPVEYELSRLRTLVDLQAAEIERLTALPSAGYPTVMPSVYQVDDTDSRHV